MHGIPSHDGPRSIDWGRTSVDYSDWRPDYPDEFYVRLKSLGVGLSGQAILDLGTGVGFLAARFASQGASVVGVDVAEGQIDAARRRAHDSGCTIDFCVAAAEETGLPDAAFDVISASQCWLYFDRERMIAEVCRLLNPDGVLLLAHFCWLPRVDEIARASEALVLRFNPDWTGADWSGEIPESPSWAAGRFAKVGGFVFDADIPFTHESWRGRLRACRGVGASLTADEVAAFDAAHAELLNAKVPADFTVRHRIDALLLRPIWNDSTS
ncbi:MAG: class I SAM-dependent methyltransferase [Planctomycetaceae bacterium]|nr:class I SAM-dependent methyltransferase [Planctomycetaceae bacterium]